MVTIERDAVLPLVRVAVPAYVPDEPEPGEERLPYADVGDVLATLVRGTGMCGSWR